MKSLLSTKKLTVSQTELLLNSGLTMVQYDAIMIHFLKFEAPSELKNAVFTSQNAVKAVFRNCHPERSRRVFQNCFCVGEKTKALLEENGKKVVKKAENASDLGQFIQKNYKSEVFYHFCGNRRREELSSSFKNSENELFEIISYKTELNPLKFDRIFDGILFFSPSGVQSFVEKNNAETSIAFCIGETTAFEAKKHFSEIVVANTTTIESTIAKAVKTLKKSTKDD